eukprot:GFKZ01013974.1.p1 GENE.GFKZ01013974.1~~GFKZ01013974.1.p1  ORF type:complete len:440 (-),score=49.57 GFKZ01013974.1:1133-2452(-)
MTLLVPQTPAATVVSQARAVCESHSQPIQIFDSDTSEPTPLISAIQSTNSTAVYALDLAVVVNQIREFRSLLPNVTPYYAVKCNPDPILLHFMANLGVSFDCASSHEISLIESILPPSALSERVIFANPFKSPSDMLMAHRLGIDLMTFDSVDELIKISQYYQRARLLIRIAVNDSSALCPLSSKFGARIEDLDDILTEVKTRGLDLVGVAFHVGSGARSVETYLHALKAAKEVFGRVNAAGLPRLSVLDIGGGFPGWDGEAPITFAEIAGEVTRCIAQLFGEEVKVIAEPGRYFATAAFELGAQVVEATESGGRRSYYLTEGVFGSFRDALLLNIEYEVKWLNMTGGEVERRVWGWCDLYGPTREPCDVVRRNVWLPELKAGDWVRFPKLGAYTTCLWTKRSGMERFKTVYCFREDDAHDDKWAGEKLGLVHVTQMVE